jgi:hypothetical protein
MTPAAADPRVDAWIKEQPKDLQALCRAARDLLDEGLPAARQDIKWGFPTWVGNGNVAALNPRAGHLNLQFYRGASLRDPDGLLEGTGKELRHVKLHSAKDVRTPGVKALVRSAWRLDREAGGRKGR